VVRRGLRRGAFADGPPAARTVGLRLNRAPAAPARRRARAHRAAGSATRTTATSRGGLALRAALWPTVPPSTASRSATNALSCCGCSLTQGYELELASRAAPLTREPTRPWTETERGRYARPRPGSVRSGGKAGVGDPGDRGIQGAVEREHDRPYNGRETAVCAREVAAERRLAVPLVGTTLKGLAQLRSVAV